MQSCLTLRPAILTLASLILLGSGCGNGTDATSLVPKDASQQPSIEGRTSSMTWGLKLRVSDDVRCLEFTSMLTQPPSTPREADRSPPPIAIPPPETCSEGDAFPLDLINGNEASAGSEHFVYGYASPDIRKVVVTLTTGSRETQPRDGLFFVSYPARLNLTSIQAIDGRGQLVYTCDAVAGDRDESFFTSGLDCPDPHFVQPQSS